MFKTITVRMPEELHRDFKIKMVLDDMTMQDRIIELIQEEVKKSNDGKVLREEYK